VFVFPEKLVDVIRTCHEKFGFKYLIPLKGNPNKPMSSSGITHQLNLILGEKLASNMLRKITASTQCPSMTGAERNELAYQAGHSTSTQQLSYMRFGGG
jgi:hypothetical protein